MSSTRMNWKTLLSVAPVLEHPLRAVGIAAVAASDDGISWWSRTAAGSRSPPSVTSRPSIFPVAIARGTSMKCPGDGVHYLRDVAVVVDRGVVRDEGIQLAVVVPDVRAACSHVHVELRCRSVERVVTREHDRIPVPGNADRVLVVVATHPVDRLRLRRSSRRARRRRRPAPCSALEQLSSGLGHESSWRKDDVARLLVREQELAIEALLLADEEVRAEPLVARALRDHVLALERHPRRAGCRLSWLTVELSRGPCRVRRERERARARGSRRCRLSLAVDPLDAIPSGSPRSGSRRASVSPTEMIASVVQPFPPSSIAGARRLEAARCRASCCGR